MHRNITIHPPPSGPPGSVEPIQLVNIEARAATVMWQDPGPILPVLYYMVTVTNLTEFDPPVPGDTVIGLNVSGNETQVVLEFLRPFREYWVEVVAVNRVGGGPTGSETFMTDTAGEYTVVQHSR